MLNDIKHSGALHLGKNFKWIIALQNLNLSKIINDSFISLNIFYFNIAGNSLNIKGAKNIAKYLEYLPNLQVLKLSNFPIYKLNPIRGK